MIRQIKSSINAFKSPPVISELSCMFILYLSSNRAVLCLETCDTFVNKQHVYLKIHHLVLVFHKKNFVINQTLLVWWCKIGKA